MMKIIVGMSLIFGLGISFWYAQREIHYKLFYKDQVIQTIKEIVKESSLK